MTYFSILVFLFAYIIPAWADAAPYFKSSAYDKGDYGAFPVDTHMSSKLESPRVNILQDNPICHDGKYMIFSPRGYGVRDQAPMILDMSGNMVWKGETKGQPYGLRVQKYRGESFLTYWDGNDAVDGHGSGTYYMLDSSYTERYALKAANNLDADLHEFHITDEGTALMSVYQTIPFDLSPIGKPKDGYLWDGILQEVNIETGELIFQWRASEHYSLDESFYQVNGLGPTSAMDFFHINSIEKDKKGNYIVSSRYMHTVTYINGTDGEIIWKLGGKNNSFKDLSNGQATNFAWQHHARWHDDFTSISLFDNGARAGLKTADYARGLLIDLDFDAMTAKLRQEYINPAKFVSSSQGSVQVLDNGNVVVGYGFNGVYTEYAPDGHVLCDVHFESASAFESGKVQSYRVFKQDWVGNPTWPPSIEVKNEIAYISWNGATEVTNWILEGANSAEPADMEFYQVKNVRKTGFETLVALGEKAGSHIRAVALNADGQVLGYSAIVESGQQKADHGLNLSESDTIPLKVMCGFIAVMGLIIIMWEIRTGYKLARQHRTNIAEAEFMLASRTSSEVQEV